MMAMRLHKEWKKNVRHAWSFRFSCISCALSGLSVGLSSAQPYLPFNPVWLSAGAGCATALAGFSTLVAQKVFDGP